MARPVNIKAKKLSKTIESRMVDAITSNNDFLINELVKEAEYLFTEEYLTPNEFNSITDIELMKEILS